MQTIRVPGSMEQTTTAGIHSTVSEALKLYSRTRRTLQVLMKESLELKRTKNPNSICHDSIESYEIPCGWYRI
jgi:hypothetical protein